MILDKGMELRQKFTGDAKADLAMLQQACEQEYNKLMEWRDQLMKKPQSTSEIQKACQDGIATLRAEKQKLVEHFKHEQEKIRTAINVYRSLK
jgi:tryptophanyl-tRNA synthetase